MATITHPTGNGYCRDRILRNRTNKMAGIVLRVSCLGPRFQVWYTSWINGLSG